MDDQPAVRHDADPRPAEQDQAAFQQRMSAAGDDPQMAALRRVQDEIRRLDLERHVSDLNVLGYTVVPPERVATPEFIGRFRDKVLEVGQRRSGVAPDLETGNSHTQFNSPFGQMPMYILFEDPLFEQVLMNEVSVALVDYLLGHRSLLSSSRGFIKARGTDALVLHTDFAGPAPFPTYSSMCNVTWALTDYSKENGSIAVVPGSHRLGRRPHGDEGVDQRVAIDAPAGSMIVFDGYTWHGAFPRQTDGLRVAYANLFCRPYLFTLEKYQGKASPEMLARNPKRFSDFMGEYLAWEYDTPDKDMVKLGETMAAAMSLY